jgi:hypothetical protein
MSLYNRSVANSGSIDLSGGEGSTTGGLSGLVFLYDEYLVQNTGAITANGGKGGTGNGGGTDTDDPLTNLPNPATIAIYSDGDVVTNAALAADGGASDGANGGFGGVIEVLGRTVKMAGASANGGASNAAAGVGGDGGYILIFGFDAPAAIGGTLSADGGTGATDGAAGLVEANGIYYAP